MPSSRDVNRPLSQTRAIAEDPELYLAGQDLPAARIRRAKMKLPKVLEKKSE